MTSNNIHELLLRIKGCIADVEMDGPSKEVLDWIERDFLQLLELTKLYLISERDTYYGYFLMSMRFRVNFASKGIAGIRLEEYPPLFESNPLLLCKFDLREVLYIVCHEIEHVVLNHPSEMLKANPQGDARLYELFNLAADASVNDRLDYEIERGCKFMRTPEGVVSSKALVAMFEIPRLRALENYKYYYDAILATGKETPESGPSRMLSSITQDGVNAGSGASAGSYSNGDGYAGVVTANNVGQPTDHEWDDERDNAEETGYAVRELVNSAVGLMNEETRGNMPAEFLEAVRRINEPPRLVWNQVLKKYVGTISAGKRKTRSRLNRRQPLRYDLSGSMDDKTLKIVVAIDTSGSVDDNQIAHIFNEMFAIMSRRKFEMTVIECDTRVRRVYRVQKREDIQLSVLGRGGTAFSPVIEHINGDRYYRDVLLVYFTDGWGERSIPRPRTYRNLWVLTHGNYLSVEEPYGVVISMEDGA